MENNTKRALSVIFAFLLLMSIFPAAAFANGSAQSGETLVAVSIEAVAEFEQSEASRNCWRPWSFPTPQGNGSLPFPAA